MPFLKSKQDKPALHSECVVQVVLAIFPTHIEPVQTAPPKHGKGVVLMSHGSPG